MRALPLLSLLLDATLTATDLVFVAPVYWYGLPADAKLYLDHWSGWMRIPELNFRAQMAGKTMCAISVFSGDDTAEAAPLFECLRRSADYMKMGWGGEVLGQGNRPGDVLTDHRSLAAARQLFT
jgi:multimeric flavodoxin WrbA